MDLTLRYAADFHIPPVLDAIAIILFAITGARSAAKRGYEWIGTMAIALVTGCGGGLIRDILLTPRPVFLEHGAYIGAVSGTVLLTIYLVPLVSRMRWIFLVVDALGLAMYAAIGTQASLKSGLGISAAILVGTLNAIGGGLIRDILTREQSSLLKPGQWTRGSHSGEACSSVSCACPLPSPGPSSFSLPSPRDFSHTAMMFGPGRSAPWDSIRMIPRRPVRRRLARQQGRTSP